MCDIINLIWKQVVKWLYNTQHKAVCL